MLRLRCWEKVCGLKESVKFLKSAKSLFNIDGWELQLVVTNCGKFLYSCSGLCVCSVLDYFFFTSYQTSSKTSTLFFRDFSIREVYIFSINKLINNKWITDKSL